MAKSSFDVGKFLERLAQTSDIYTGDSIATMPDSDVPSNVINAEDWKRQELQKQLQNVPDNLAETQPYLPGGEYNQRQAPVAAAPAQQEGVLAATTSKPSVPVGQVTNAPLSAVPDTTTLAKTGKSAQDEMIAQSRQIKADNPQVAADYELPEIIIEGDKESDTPVLDQLESLASIFRKHMNKVEKVQYDKLSKDQKSDVRLRFFLALMAEGGKKNGKGLLGNMGTAGLTAMDAKRVIQNQNNVNENARFTRESKAIYDALTLTGRDRTHKISAQRWKEAAKAAAAKIKAGQMKTIKGKKGWELVDMTTGQTKPVLDSQGKQIQHDGSDGRALSGEVAVLNYLEAGGDKGKQKSRMELYKKAQGAKVNTSAKAAKPISDFKKKESAAKLANDILKESKDEFGRTDMTMEQAKAEAHNRLGLPYESSYPGTGNTGKKTGMDAISHLPPDVQKGAIDVFGKINKGEMSKEQGVAELKEKYPDINW